MSENQTINEGDVAALTPEQRVNARMDAIIAESDSARVVMEEELENLRRQNSVMSSPDSSDLSVDKNPLTGRMTINIRDDVKDELAGDTLPPTAGKKAEMVLKLTAIDPGNENSTLTYDWGFLRLVPETEL